MSSGAREIPKHIENMLVEIEKRIGAVGDSGDKLDFKDCHNSWACVLLEAQSKIDAEYRLKLNEALNTIAEAVEDLDRSYNITIKGGARGLGILPHDSEEDMGDGTLRIWNVDGELKGELEVVGMHFTVEFDEGNEDA